MALDDNGGWRGVEHISADDQFDFIKKILEPDTNDQFEIFNTSPYNETNISTSYINVDSVPTKSNNNSLILMSLNIQSLAAKFNEFSDLINYMMTQNKAPDIICLQELWKITDPDQFELDVYQPLIFNTRCNTRGGGVGIYIKNNICFNTLPQFSIFHERIFESVVVEISSTNGKKFIVGSVYRPGTPIPNTTFNEQFNLFADNLTASLTNLANKNENVFLCGDLNLDLLKFNENKFIRDYIDLIFANGFIQIVSKPTRITKDSATVIDHILTNQLPNECKTMILCNKISDHFPILYSIKTDNNYINTPQSLTTRNFSALNTQHFISSMTNMTWNHVLTNYDTQLAYDSFSDTFYDIFNLYFPIQTKKINKRYHNLEPWMTSGILKSRRTKLFLNNLSIRKPTHINREKFKQYRNLYNSVIRTAKKLYFNNKITEYKNNLQKTWQTLFTVIRKGKKKKNGCQALLINNKLSTDPAAIAEHLNNFYSEAVANLTSNINHTSKSPLDLIQQNENTFSFTNIPLTENEVLEAVYSLKDKNTLDFNGISSSFLKKIMPYIITPIKHVFELSLTNGIVPKQLKIAKVVPIFKSGDPQNCDNYRPISLLNPGTPSGR